MKIIFFGTSKFAVSALKKLKSSNHAVAAVVTQPDRKAGRHLKVLPSPVKKEAEKIDVPIHQPQDITKKPGIRTFHKKARDHEMFLTVVPGIPEVGRAVEMQLRAFKIPKTPHPQYGARIPMDNAIIVATAAHEKELTTSIDYLLHPIGDPGTFGFHFTPVSKGYHNIIFAGEFEHERTLRFLS